MIHALAIMLGALAALVVLVVVLALLLSRAIDVAFNNLGDDL